MKLVLEQALEPELVRVQVLQVQTLVRVQLEPLVQLELLAQAQVQLELEQRLQQSCPKLQLHRHRCKVPDRSQESQRKLCQTQAHPKASDMTPLALVQRELQVLEQAQVPEWEQRQEWAAQLAQ